MGCSISGRAGPASLRHRPVSNPQAKFVHLTSASHGAQYVGEEAESPGGIAAQADAAVEEADAVGEGASAPSGVRTSAMLGCRSSPPPP